MIHTHIHDFGQLIVTTDINHKLNWTVGGNQRTSPTEHPQPIHVYCTPYRRTTSFHLLSSCCEAVWPILHVHVLNSYHKKEIGETLND